MAFEEEIKKISELTVSDIVAVLNGKGVKLHWSKIRNKSELLDALSEQPEEVISALVLQVQSKLDKKNSIRQENKAENLKRQGKQKQEQRQAKRQRQDTQPTVEPLAFLFPPSSDDRQRCHKLFLDATSNAALETSVCVSCAQELHHSAGRFEFLDSLKHPERLIPKRPHPAHTTINSMLLVVEKVTEVDGRARGWFCNDCMRALDANRLPPLSLANGMWVGPIPPELSRLTLPERILISLYHPRAYIIKLIPRNLWGGDSSQLQTGLKGNVTTYELNMPDVVRMLEGKMMPRPTSLLASVIAVTFVGLGKVPKSWLKQTFQVRRDAVRDALRCLKEVTRHPGYVDIEISEAELARLPDGEVPEEILETIRREDDLEQAQKEAATYSVPDEPMNESHNVPGAIPLQFLGAVDTDLSKVSPEEVLLYGLANVDGSNSNEGGYAIRHSRNPVSDFSQPNRKSQGSASSLPIRNYSVYAFPCDYPYGEGGIEATREVPVPIEEHIRHNLRYWDRRFRVHPTWAFVFFSILQKRQAMMAARLQMSRRDFDEVTRLFSTLTREHLAAAVEAEANGRTVEDPRILLLRRFIHCGGAKVMGSDYSRASYRSEIWSTMLSLNPPSIWITINPVDIHDPIMQVFAGEKINMDEFRATLGPDSQQRAANVAKDPYAAAHFFNFLIHLILETLFGIKSENRKVKTSMGVLGRLTGHYGVVEAQGRGSLHVHMLLWLEGAPSSDEMQIKLQSEEFRRRVADYVDANVKAHLDGMTEDLINDTTREPELAWSRPPNPDTTSYEDDLVTRERSLVRAQQVHICKKSTCLQWKHRLGEWVCKRRAPFPLSPNTTVSSDGTITPKRTYGYLNNWNPSVLVYGSCNNDIKFISHGVQARAIIWYITAYQTKKQLRSFNWSALLAETLAYHERHSEYLDNMRERNRLLVFRCLHALNRQIELSGQQVMSYLLGFGDKFCSHSYTPLYWSSIAAEILRVWPNIKNSVPIRTEGEDHRNSHNSEDDSGDDDSSEADSVLGNKEAEGSQDEGREEVILESLPSGALIHRSQLTDYKYRGRLFEDMNFFDFIADTWEDDYRPPQNAHHTAESSNKRGAPPHLRDSYLSGHPRSTTRQRVRRAAGHNMLPNVVGPYLPRSDDPSTHQFYCASMLALLKPWRDVRELLPVGQSWVDIFHSFLSSATPRQRNIISGAQYYYQCRDAADQSANEHPEISTGSANRLDGSIDESVEEPGSQTKSVLPEPTEAEMIVLLESMQNQRELLHGKEAVAIARGTNLFRASLERSWSAKGFSARIATQEDQQRIASWRNAMLKDAATRKDKNDAVPTTQPQMADSGVIPMSTMYSLGPGPSHGSVVAEPLVEEVIRPVETSHLKEDQLRGFQIVTKHLSLLLAKQSPNQLLMQIQGEGGTGKSMVIHCIMQFFRANKAEHKILTSAYTGIAASHVDGNTLHTLCCLMQIQKDNKREGPEGRLPSNLEIKPKLLDELRRTWRDVEYLIIDEISMVSRELLALVSSVLSAAKQSGQPADSRPFGGINMIIIGDFHQFPPVACGPTGPLYWPSGVSPEQGVRANIGGQRKSGQKKEESIEARTGGDTYRKFRTVVLLREQCRTTDETWRTVLQHARTGTCTPEHLATIRGLIMASDTVGGGGASVDDPAWQDGVLVTPRHAVRIAWNQMATRRHCAKNQTQLFICPAEDQISRRPLTVSETYYATKASGKKRGDRSSRKEKGNLPDVVELAVGMEVMVTYNVETELDVANGARGVIQEIILDRRELIPDGLGQSPREVTLAFPPECVLVKLTRTKAHALPGLEQGVVPIVPMERGYEIALKDGKRKRVKRRQLPMTAAYAFTDYRAQGQTIRRVIVDIARRPSGELTAFNAYVALSRSSGRSTIRLLRDFDDRLFTNTPCEKLKDEDERLRVLDKETKRRWELGETVWDHPEHALEI